MVLNALNFTFINVWQNIQGHTHHTINSPKITFHSPELDCFEHYISDIEKYLRVSNLSALISSQNVERFSNVGFMLVFFNSNFSTRTATMSPNKHKWILDAKFQLSWAHWILFQDIQPILLYFFYNRLIFKNFLVSLTYNSTIESPPTISIYVTIIQSVTWIHVSCKNELKHTTIFWKIGLHCSNYHFCKSNHFFQFYLLQ